MVTGWIHWIALSECVNAKNFGLQEENINFSKPQGKTTNYETGMGNHRKRERQMDRKKRGRMQCFMKKKDTSLIDVENVLKSQVVLLQTAHSWANAGVLLGARMHRERGSFRRN